MKRKRRQGVDRPGRHIENAGMATDYKTSIQNHWLFTGIESEALTPLLEASHEVRFMPNEVVFREGDPADGLYLITGGSMRIAAQADSGSVMLAVVSTNDVVGEMGVLDG